MGPKEDPLLGSEASFKWELPRTQVETKAWFSSEDYSTDISWGTGT